MKKIGLLIGAALLFQSLFLYSEQIPDLPNPFLEITEARFDSLNVRLVGNWPFGASFAVSHDSLRSIAFCSSGGGVCCLDISDPRNPLKISEAIHTRSFIFQLFYCYDSQLLLTGSDPNILEIWDVSDAAYPSKRGAWFAPGQLSDIFVVDTLAFLAVIDSGMYVLNISNPVNPQQIGFWQKDGWGSLFVEGTYAYFGCYDFSVVDISNPANPQLVTSYHPFSLGISDIEVQGSYAYLSNTYALDSMDIYLIDISTPSNPQIISSCHVDETDGRHIDVNGSYLYIANYEGVSLVDVSDPYNPHWISMCVCPTADVTVSGSYAYASRSSFFVIDVTPPNNPRVIGEYKIPNEAIDVFVAQPYIYVADSYSGLRIIDYTDPLFPFEIGNNSFEGNASAIAMNGSYAYVCDEYASLDGMALRIFDISDPYNPQQVSICYSAVKPGWTRCVQIQGNYAYVAMRNWLVGSEDGLWIVDVSDPMNPFEAGFFITSTDDVFDVFVVDTLAFLAAENFYIVDVSDPANPSQVGFYNTDYAHGVCVDGSYAYVADAFVGVLILDISDPTNPVFVGSYISNNSPSKLALDGSLLYVSDRMDNVLRVLDVASPTTPQEVGYYELSETRNVFYHQPYIFVADGNMGVQILEFFGAGMGEEEKSPANGYSLRLFKNPIRDSRISLSLLLAHHGSVEIALYNEIGQRVRTYNRSGLKTGRNKLQLDASGLASGVYFLKVRNMPNLPPKKLILLD